MNHEMGLASNAIELLQDSADTSEQAVLIVNSPSMTTELWAQGTTTRMLLEMQFKMANIRKKLGGDILWLNSVVKLGELHNQNCLLASPRGKLLQLDGIGGQMIFKVHHIRLPALLWSSCDAVYAAKPLFRSSAMLHAVLSRLVTWLLLVLRLV